MIEHPILKQYDDLHRNMEVDMKVVGGKEMKVNNPQVGTSEAVTDSGSAKGDVLLEEKRQSSIDSHYNNDSDEENNDNGSGGGGGRVLAVADVSVEEADEEEDDMGEASCNTISTTMPSTPCSSIGSRITAVLSPATATALTAVTAAQCPAAAFEVEFVNSSNNSNSSNDKPKKKTRWWWCCRCPVFLQRVYHHCKVNILNILIAEELLLIAALH